MAGDDAYRLLARVGDVPPGHMICIEVDGRSVLLANADGEFLATDDTCTHEDASLAGGSLRGCLVKCPLHGSRFDLRTGAPIEEPADEPLRCYAVKVAGDRILARLF